MKITRTSSVAAFLIAGFLIVAAPLFASDESAFSKEMKKVRSLMARSRWDSAYNKLIDLLEEHAGCDYVLAKRAEIEESAKSCTFWKSYDTPDPDDLVSGDLISYTPSKGSIKIKYNRKNTEDFLIEKAEDSKGVPTYIHPLLFDGPYTIEIKGSRYPKKGSGSRPSVGICNTSDESYLVDFGHNPGRGSSYYNACIAHFNGTNWRNVDTKREPPSKEKKPYHFKIKVTKTAIIAYVGNKKLLQAKKDKDLFGRIFIRNLPFDELFIEGKVQPAWIQGLLDARAQEARTVFDKSWRRGEYLPHWLLTETAVEKRETDAKEEKNYPGLQASSQNKLVNQAIDFFESKEYRKGLDFIEGIPERDLTEGARLFYLMLFHDGLEEYGEALLYCRQACEVDPEFFYTHYFEAYLYNELGHREKSLKTYEALLDGYPDEESIYEDMVELFLEDGRPEKAKEVMERALRNGLQSKKIESLNRVLSYALNGPSWDKVYDVESRHYHVYSDIDRTICREASKLLEEAYISYTVYLERIPGLEKKKFPVYLFSGQAGYMAYTESFSGKSTMLSSGLYYPRLKQLLIWNLPDRDRMLRTIRHEGFHQYLDRLMKVDPPAWFNEGLAVYYELARRERGEWKLGVIHPYHIKTLEEKKNDLIPLSTFLYQGYSDFYKNSDVTYAQGWAFIHFLRHGSMKNRKLFNTFFEELQGDVPARQVVQKVLRTIDLNELEAEFKDHVEDLVYSD